MILATQQTIQSLLLEASLFEHVPTALFVFVFGACVGSFLNVVIYRLPRNIRLLVPASQCPSCQHRLRFFRENLPIIGWFALRGKCRYCKEPISIEYPCIEFLTAILFLLCYVLCYWIPSSTPFLGEVFGPWWQENGIVKTLPMFISLLTLVAGLLSMTRIDARTFTIPIQIPVFMSLVAFIAALVQSWFTLRHTSEQPWPYPLISWTWAGAAFGGMLGVLLTTILLKCGFFTYSFLDYEEYIEGDANLANYPHARREMGREFVVLVPIILGIILGWMICYEQGYPSLQVQGIAGSMLGYLVGGGLVWSVRILGTLGFGKEAMGLGDVHLLAGVGAVVGWWDPILIFFIAPFSGLLWVAISLIFEKIGKQFKEIPYGPHLAVATLIVVFCRPAVDWVWSIAMPHVEMPPHEKIQTNLPQVDLTNDRKNVSIHITPLPVGNGNVEQDVLLRFGESSDMEKGHA